MRRSIKTGAGDPTAVSVKALAELGAPNAVGRCLAVGPEALAAAVGVELAPKVLHAAVMERAGASLAVIEAGSVEMVVTADVLGVGTVGEAARAVAAMAAALVAGGRLAAVIDTYPTRVDKPGVGADDLVLFPDLAALGHLGATAETRTPLTAGAWLALIGAVGLTVSAVSGHGDSPLDDQTLDRHAARLAPFDPKEVATGRLLVLADKAGAAA